MSVDLISRTSPITAGLLASLQTNYLRIFSQENAEHQRSSQRPYDQDVYYNNTRQWRRVAPRTSLQER